MFPSQTSLGQYPPSGFPVDNQPFASATYPLSRQAGGQSQAFAIIYVRGMFTASSRFEAMWREETPRTSSNPLRELFDAALRGYAIKLTCKCEHVVVLHPHAVWWHFRRKGFSERLRDVPGRFRCQRCDGRDPDMQLVHEPVTETLLPLPTELEWKQEMSRRR